MEIIGIGSEIVECVRIRRMVQRFGELFLTRVYTDREVRFCQSRNRAVEHFAGIWAAKQAVIQSLASRPLLGINWRDIEVRHPGYRRHVVLVGGRAKEVAIQKEVEDLLVTVSRCRTHAFAYVLAVRGDQAAAQD